jgi:putative phosphoribosyl transferase
MRFKDRVEAGEKLADKLAEVVKGKGVVLGIPRGGVVTAKVVAKRLGWPLNVIVTKKIGYPGHEELAMGAIAEDGEPVWDERLRQQVGMSKEEEEKLVNQVRQEKVKKYVEKFRKGKDLVVKGKTVIMVDDGIATGRTVEAGIKWLRGKGVGKIVVGMPVCARDSAKRLKKLVDEWVCLDTPWNFMAVGQFYEEFTQIDDEEVKSILDS